MRKYFRISRNFTDAVIDSNLELYHTVSSVGKNIGSSDLIEYPNLPQYFLRQHSSQQLETSQKHLSPWRPSF